MANYPPAIQRRSNKHGYKNDDTLREEGIVAHSMVGSIAAAFGRLDGPDAASWHFSVAKNGDVYQHLDTTHISYASGSYDANKRFWSIEHEGGPNGNFTEPLTVAQTEATADLMGWLLGLGGLPAIRRQTLWEHKEMLAYGASPTACPSGRIPWVEIIAEIEGDEMTPEEKQQLDSATADNHTQGLQIKDVTTLAAANAEAINTLIQQVKDVTNLAVAAQNQLNAHAASPHAGGEHEHTVTGKAE